MRQTVTTRKIWKTSNKVYVSGNCDDICYTRTESKVHVHTCHEGEDNNEVKKKAKRNVNDENYIWKGRRRKLLQTSSIQIPMPTDNQEKRKKWLMPIGLNYQGHGVSKKDVWMINSYYRISDGERGDRK